MSARRPDLGDITEKELEQVEKVLGLCHCEVAWAGRGLAQQDCHFCAGAADVLDLVRRAQKAEARVAELEAENADLKGRVEDYATLLGERMKAAGRGGAVEGGK